MSDASETPHKLPGRTTPTWEMELLVSGVTVFALLQLPGWMDQAYLALQLKLDLDWDQAARLWFIYSKIGALILAAAFVLHLMMRGYWIALVGMDSIYPEGVLLDRLRIGPLQRRFVRANSTPIREQIETADNRASIVFAVGITMARVMVGLVLVVFLACLLTASLRSLLGWPWLFPNGSFLLVAICGLPYALAFLVDRYWGDRLHPDSAAARGITALFALYRRMGFGLDGNPTIRLLQSHVGVRKTTVVTTIAVTACALFASAQLVLQKGDLRLGDYGRWPAAELGAEDSLIGPHYRDQPRPDNSLLPSIDSMFPSGDYLSLVEPFNPKRYPALLAQRCGNVWHAEDSPGRRAALLDCLQQAQDLRLDGRPLAQVQLRYYSDPTTGQDSVIAVVPIRGLAAGEHVLTLLRPANPEQTDGAPATDRYRISFWR
jgi:hypothetical protein